MPRIQLPRMNYFFYQFHPCNQTHPYLFNALHLLCDFMVVGYYLFIAKGKIIRKAGNKGKKKEGINIYIDDNI